MNDLIKLDNWLIDKFFQRIMDYCNFKFGTTKFICYQFLILVMFFCNCKSFYNQRFLVFLIFSTWMLLETINNFIDSFINVDYINKFQKKSYFYIRCYISALWFLSLVSECFDFSVFETMFWVTAIILNYAKYCSINPKYKFKKKEKKLKISKLVFA